MTSPADSSSSASPVLVPAGPATSSPTPSSTAWTCSTEEWPTAAITNTCAMGRLLSALPYNRPRRPTLPATETARRLGDGIAA